MKKKKLFQKIIERRNWNFCENTCRSDVERQFFQEKEKFQKNLARFFIELDDVKKFKKDLHFEPHIFPQSTVHEPH